MEDDVDDDENDKSSEKRRDKEKLLQKLKDDKTNRTTEQSENTNRDRQQMLDRFSKSTEKHAKTKNILTNKLLKQGLREHRRRNSFPSIEEMIRLDIYYDIDKALNEHPLDKMVAGRDINSTYGFIRTNFSPHNVDNLNFTDLSFLKYRESKELISFSDSPTFQQSGNDNNGSSDTEIVFSGGQTGLNKDDMCDYTKEFNLDSLNKLRLQDEDKQQLLDLDRINRGEYLDGRKISSTDDSEKSALYIHHRQGDSETDSPSESITTQRSNSRQGWKSFECTEEEREQKLSTWRERQKQMDLDTTGTERVVDISEPEKVKTATQQQNEHIKKILQGTQKAIISPTSQSGKFTKEVRQIETQQREQGFKCNLKVPQNEEEMEALRQRVIRVSIQRCSADVERLKNKLQADMEQLERQEAMVINNYNKFGKSDKENK